MRYGCAHLATNTKTVYIYIRKSGSLDIRICRYPDPITIVSDRFEIGKEILVSVGGSISDTGTNEKPPCVCVLHVDVCML